MKGWAFAPVLVVDASEVARTQVGEVFRGARFRSGLGCESVPRHEKRRGGSSPEAFRRAARRVAVPISVLS